MNELKDVRNTIKMLKSSLNNVGAMGKETMVSVQHLKSGVRTLSAATFMKKNDTMSVFPLRDQQALEAYIASDPKLEAMYTR